MEDIHRNGRTGWEGEGGEESSLQVKTLKASYLAYIKGQPINFCSTLPNKVAHTNTNDCSKHPVTPKCMHTV